MRIPAHSVCTAIRDDIVSGVFERGSRLTEELLARRYGVSRVPVREALRTLESEDEVEHRRAVRAYAWLLHLRGQAEAALPYYQMSASRSRPDAAFSSSERTTPLRILR